MVVHFATGKKQGMVLATTARSLLLFFLVWQQGMVLATTARSLLLFFALCCNEIEGWTIHGIAGLCRDRYITPSKARLERSRRSRMPQRRLGNSLFSVTTTLPQDGGQESSSSTPLDLVSIRESLHGDLGKCADVVMSAFYPNYRNPFKHMVRLAELSRLQQSFSYDKTQHVMFVAEVAIGESNNQIVGFCDVDLRPPNRPMPYSYNPRPYISDLSVHAEYRRRGVGRELVLRCEEFCVKAGKNRTYIRVEGKNTAALNLYRRLGYVAIDNPDCFDRSVLLLTKDLHASRLKIVENTTIKDDQDPSGTSAPNQTDH